MKNRVILASGSPRRRELLGLIYDDFEVIPSSADETLTPGTPPQEAVKELARRKAADIGAANPEALVIGADTVVYCSGEILGKPADEADAFRMLRLLSGKTHSVFTGVCLLKNGMESVFAEETKVTFFPLSDEEISAYIASGEPFDKAGAYGIQGKGALLTEKIEGDFFNVVGLPTARLAQALKKF